MKMAITFTYNQAYSNSCHVIVRCGLIFMYIHLMLATRKCLILYFLKVCQDTCGNIPHSKHTKLFFRFAQHMHRSWAFKLTHNYINLPLKVLLIVLIRHSSTKYIADHLILQIASCMYLGILPQGNDHEFTI